MGAGMPGFGIASIFYIVAALFAPVHELWRISQGTSTRQRRAASITQFCLGAGMIAALVGFYLCLDILIDRGLVNVKDGDRIGTVPNWITAAIILLLVLAAGAVWGGVASLFAADDDPDQIAAAYRAGVAQIVLDLRVRVDVGDPLLVPETVVSRPAKEKSPVYSLGISGKHVGMVAIEVEVDPIFDLIGAALLKFYPFEVCRVDLVPTAARIQALRN